MPMIYLSPSTQEFNPYITGNGSEEYFMNRIADEMERFPEEEQVADAAVRFALMSYAAGLASSYYVARLRETAAPAPTKNKKAPRAKKEEP